MSVSSSRVCESAAAGIGAGLRRCARDASIRSLRRAVPLLACAVIGACAVPGVARGSSDGDETTGRMLYTAQCSGCHRAQIHWRDKKVARDWPTLVKEVRRWQHNSGLAWTDDEILAVARYLNATWYRFPAADSKELAREDGVRR